MGPVNVLIVEDEGIIALDIQGAVCLLYTSDAADE